MIYIRMSSRARPLICFLLSRAENARRESWGYPGEIARGKQRSSVGGDKVLPMGSERRPGARSHKALNGLCVVPWISFQGRSFGEISGVTWYMSYKGHSGCCAATRVRGRQGGAERLIRRLLQQPKRRTKYISKSAKASDKLRLNITPIITSANYLISVSL